LAWAASAEQFDLVLTGGRVIDPETGLDATRDVGLRGGQLSIRKIQDLAAQS